MADYDVIIIGANTPALVAAAYMGKLGGLKSLILEKSKWVGATAMTIEMVPGYQFHPAATGEYYVDYTVEKELELEKFGLVKIPANPMLTTTFGDGKYLSIYADVDATCDEIGKFSKKDAEAYKPFIQKWLRVGQFYGMAQMNAPLPFSQFVASMSASPDLEELMRDMLFGSIKDILERTFENDYVKAAFLTLSEGGNLGPSGAPFFFGVGRVLSPWGFVKGGLKSVGEVLEKAAIKNGATIKREAEVSKILVKDGKAYGVKLASGEEIIANTIVSELELGKTFLDLVGPDHLPADFIRKVNEIIYECGGVTFNLALNSLPDFGFPEDRYRGFFGITPPGYDYFEEAFGQYHIGEIPNNICSMTYLPSYIEPKVFAPEGKHVLTGYIFPIPYYLRKGNWETRKQELFDKWIEALARFSPNIKKLVTGCGGFSPLELEQKFSMTNGDLGHGTFRWINQLSFRPVVGWSQYRSPIQNLYMAGQATHPPSGVGGIGGINVARAVLEDLKKGKKGK
jgi:phytoene dehydrogenase-like protein